MQSNPPVLILVAISMVAPAGINIIAPSMPAFVDVFDTDYGTVQLTLSLFLVTIAVAQLVIGPLSDYFGRRPIVLYGMLLSLVGSLICMSAPTIEIFIFGRVLQGMGACTGIVLARTIIRDLYAREKAASMIGYVTMAMTTSPMVVPFIGGFLQENVAWWGSSVFMFVFTLMIVIGAFFLLYETNPNLGKRTSVSKLGADYKALIRNRLFLAYVLTSGLASAVYFSFMGGAPLLTVHLYDLSPTGYGLYFIMIAVGYGVGNYLSGRFSERFGVVRMIVGGSLVNIAGVFLLMTGFILGLDHPLGLFMPVFVTSLANGLCLPSTIAGAVSVDPHIAGSASGITGFTQIGFGAIAATLTAEWLDVFLSAWAMITVMAVGSILAFIAALWVRQLETRHHA